MRKCMNFILLALCMVLLLSCQKQESKIVLLFSPEESRVEDGAEVYKHDSIVISPINCDSSRMIQYTEGHIHARNVFIKKDNAIFEKYSIYTTNEIPGKFICYDSILTFARKDTTFFYKSKMDFLAKGLGKLDYDRTYTIKRFGDGYVTIKNCCDYEKVREIYFYDKNYNIYKYILTIHINMFVYNKKE